jgi:6-pyruvoyl-tetrahydropterin synthase
MGKTRKLKNKKIFLRWLKKSRSHINKYSIKHGGEDGPNDRSKSKELAKYNSGSSGSSTLADESKLKKNAIVLAAVVTLGEVAYTLASNPVIVSAVIGLGVGSSAFAGVASGGALLVVIAVGTYAYFKIKAAYANYYSMIHVMNDYILLLQKIDTMVRIAIKISEQYQFVIDTKDVNKSLERIFSKFDKLLSIEDIGKIKKEVQDNGGNIENTLKTIAEDAADAQDNELLPQDESAAKPKEPEEITVKLTFLQKLKKFIKTVKFNSKIFTNELNEEITRLGLYFSILLGEFNIILNVCQMSMIGKRNFAKLLNQNGIIKDSEDFKKLLISSLIYRTLQIYNIFILCKPGALISDSAKKTTCSEDSMEQYTIEVDAERVKIRKVLFGKSKSNSKSLFPLYNDINFNTGDDSLLNQLRQIMKPFDKSISDKNQAIDFVNKIHAFNEKYSAATKKTISDSTSGSTVSTDQYLLGRDYYEDTGSPIVNESKTEQDVGL